jgi:hypothetical protein
LAATCRKVSHHEAVAWCKRYVFRKIQTQGNCEPQKGLAAASKRMTYSTKVAWHRGHNDRRYDQDSVVHENWEEMVEGPRMQQW